MVDETRGPVQETITVDPVAGQRVPVSGLLQGQDPGLGHEPAGFGQRGSGQIDHGGGPTEVGGKHRLVGERVADELDVSGAVRHLQIEVEPHAGLADHARVLAKPSGERGEPGTEAEQMASHIAARLPCQFADRLVLDGYGPDQVAGPEERVGCVVTEQLHAEVVHQLGRDVAAW